MFRLLICLFLLAADNTLADDPDYLGSKVCGECHEVAWRNWQSSHHAAAMARPSASTVKGDFNHVTVTFHGFASTFSQDENGNYQVRTRTENGEQVFPIAYTFGTSPLQQFLVSTEEGRLQALNIAWDDRPASAGGQRWFHLQPDEPISTDSPFFWTRHLQNWNSRCADCHSTGVIKGYDRETNSFNTTFEEISVGCEACHGPGGSHAERPAEVGMSRAESRLNWSFKADNAIASPKGESTGAQINMCGGCHSRREVINQIEPGQPYSDTYHLALPEPPLYYLDGQVRDEVFVLGSFLQSKMHGAGVTCTNCHEPHSGQLLTEGNGLCAQCHRADVFDTAGHLGHIKGQAGSFCVDCHMPATTYMQVDDRRDHRFGIPSPQLTRELGVPNACSQCHNDKPLEWIMATRDFPRPQRFARLMADLTTGSSFSQKELIAFITEPEQPDLQKAALVRQLGHRPDPQLQNLLENLKTSNSPFIRAAVAAASASLTPGAQLAILDTLNNDPVRAVRIEVGKAIAPRLNRLPVNQARRFLKAVNEAGASLDQQSDNPGSVAELATLESQLGNLEKAKDHYEQALRIEPDFIPALINYADLARAQNDEEKTGELLQRALRFAPESSAINFSYGLHLIRLMEYDSAVSYLETAAEGIGAEPGYAYTYAVALDHIGKTSYALTTLFEAQSRWPENIELRILEILYLDKTGQPSRIAEQLEVLKDLAPYHPQVQALAARHSQRAD